MPHAACTDTCVVIPLYNEAQVIADVIASVRQVFPTVVCIDDGSTDDSAERAFAAGATVIPHPINLGQGASLQTGFDYVMRATTKQWVVTFDADGQHSVDDARAMVERGARENLDIVYGSRFLQGRAETGLAKRIVLKTAARVTAMRTGVKLTDAHNGLRVLSRRAVGQIRLNHNRMAHASEIVVQLAKTELPWAEHPVHITYTDYSRAKGQSLLNSVNILTDLIID
ncbi:glycosyltransferase family 2 protein [Nanchangia anserum]|uniref:Glycosyltransferase family 2 protein n=1 Tax=Nanchangia anserum TaxID=2692125 RepID=A0A8I0KUV8_9ACTO|nr:glycosyltransferase family 2 protein [Nanchangia anserum]MBD3690113.1 glycosyltransferase family 2 protein [Nanchangia anserum]QOX82102.1 glycosyltransferase family 2 protein [Nanchangia anserum]